MGSTDWISLLTDFQFGRSWQCLAISLSSREERWRFVETVQSTWISSTSFAGAFLIPYFILYFLIGAPIYYLELALGQFSSRGPATAFIFARGWQGSVEMLVPVLVDISHRFRSRHRHDHQQCAGYALLQRHYCLGLLLLRSFVPCNSTLVEVWAVVEHRSMLCSWVYTKLYQFEWNAMELYGSAIREFL